MDKKKLQQLDDIGFIGTQEKMSPFVRERMLKKTGEFIKAHRAAQSKTVRANTKVKKAS